MSTEKEEQKFNQEYRENPEAFSARKGEVIQWLRAPKQIDSRGIEEPLDDSITAVIRDLNEKLSFLYTTASCGGHFYSREDIKKKYPDVTDDQLILPHEGYIAGGGGYVSFEVDGTNRSKQFLVELQKIIEKYPEAKLVKRDDNNYNLELIRQPDDDEAFTLDEARRAKTQIKELLVEIAGLVANSASHQFFNHKVELNNYKLVTNQNTMNQEQPKVEKDRTADYLAPGAVIMDKFYYDNPQKIRDFFSSYVESIRKEGIQSDPEKFAREMIDGFLNDYEHGIKVWREILTERGNKEEK